MKDVSPLFFCFLSFSYLFDRTGGGRQKIVFSKEQHFCVISCIINRMYGRKAFFSMKARLQRHL